jgi:adenylate cyclase
MVQAGGMPRLGGSAEEITAYFSDIQDFSTFSELLPPERLVELLNEYLSACTDVIQDAGGTLDKYIGDAVVAMFGAPLALPGHAHHACLAALRSQARLAELRERWRAAGAWPEAVNAMQSRIGLNTGVAVVGNMGSRVRFNYTMMGDSVNLAARMESGAKHWGVHVMCTEATRAACELHAPGRVVFRPLGRIVVKGRSEPVPIHEVFGEAGALPAGGAECVATFTRGLELYRARDWAGARREFEAGAALEPRVPGRTPGVKSNPSLVFLGLVERFAREAPPEGWDGTHVMTEK